MATSGKSGLSQTVRRLAAEVLAMISALKLAQTEPMSRERLTCCCYGCWISISISPFLLASGADSSVQTWAQISVGYKRSKYSWAIGCCTGGRWLSLPKILNQDALHQLPWHQQTTIFRLRTGHCRLNSHLKRIGIKPSAQCPCGEADQTPEQYVQSCSLYHQARQQIWSTYVSLKTKLWGSAEHLLLTS